MGTPEEVLKKYWGYDHFRPLQKDIIQSVLEGYDTLALLPTGGGKSICFQVPSMMMEGLCLVISPLIALMRDQVDQLRKKGIKALALHSGMSHKEIDISLDNCAYDAVKFLYVSPERLKTDIFRQRMEKIPVSMLAVDEAHCISQWGYDFRPPYLEIGDFRKDFGIEKTIALTATATPEVVKDIHEKLGFLESKTFQKSFARANLSYSCFQTDRKDDKLIQVIKGTHGSGVVYANTRKRTRDIALFLKQNGIDADFYHAGLPSQERDRKQKSWIQGATRIIVATNAFGMGIDKPDVRSVVHMDLPFTLEAYYQEAGRAGRDEQKAYAVLIFNQQDINDFKVRVEQKEASPELIKRTYQALANKYKLAIGSGGDMTFDFDYLSFTKSFDLPSVETFNALKRLDDEGIIRLTGGVLRPSKLHMNINKEDLYRFQVSHANLDPLIKALLRLYGGELFTQFVSIKESELAKYMKIEDGLVRKELDRLDELDIADYQPGTDRPQIIFSMPRMDVNALPLDQKKIEWRKKVNLEKAESVTKYITDTRQCRTRILQGYFGEQTDVDCGVCDYCINRKKTGHVSTSMVLNAIPEKGIDSLHIAQRLGVSEILLEPVLRELVEDGKIKIEGSAIVRLK